MKYGTIGEDGCPCGDYEDEHIVLRSHCWRSKVDGCDCGYSGVHFTVKVGVDLDVAKKKAHEISTHIRDSWNTDVKIEMESIPEAFR